MKKQEEIKIKIRRNDTEDNNAENVFMSEADMTEDSATPEVKTKSGKFFSLERLSAFVFYILVFLMPIFVLPIVVAPTASGKTVLFFGGVFLTAFLFVLSAIRKGSVTVPKSALFLSCGAVVLVWLASALFSGNIGLSLVGKLYDIDTFLIVLASFLALFFGSMIVKSEKRAVVFYITLFCSAIIVFLFQFFHIIFGVNIVPFNIFPYKTSSLIGGWNDFSVFFGLTGILALTFLETAKLKKKVNFFLYIILIMSFFAMMASNFSNSWIVFGIFSLIIFIGALFKSQSVEEFVSKKIIRVSLFAIVLVLFFVLFKGTTGKITGLLGTSFSEVRPSLQATMDIAKQSLKESPVLGTGPNTFLYDWQKFKPASINNTIFWNARFVSGSGFLPSALATTGIFGIVSIIILLIILLCQFGKVFSKGQSTINDSLTTVSFLGSIYLWTHIVLYTPGVLVFALAFVFTGLFLALLVNTGKVKVININLSGKTKTNLISMVVAFALLAGAIYAFYFSVRKFLALNNYSQAISIFEKTGDIKKTKEKLLKAVKADKQDEYYRTLSELGLISLGQLMADKNISEDTIGALFQEELLFAVSYAQEAVKINPIDPINLMQLGRVYESVVSLKVDKADEAALGAYAQAFKVSPFDPSPFVASARIALEMKKVDDAKKYLQSALVLKPDFTDALFMLSQIEAQAGNLKEAILKTEQSAMSSPNNPGILFQLGLLNYQNKDYDKAGLALESAVAINSEYANARYFLGLVYDKQGKKDKAIEQFEIIQKANPDNQEINKILNNLMDGKNALAEIAPPSPEKRSEPPVSEKDKTALQKAKKK